MGLAILALSASAFSDIRKLTPEQRRQPGESLEAYAKRSEGNPHVRIRRDKDGNIINSSAGNVKIIGTTVDAKKDTKSTTVIETPAAEHIATTNIYGQPMIVPVHNAVEGQTIHKPENSKPVITPDGGLMVVVGFNIPTTQDNSTTNIVIPSIPYTTGDTGTTTNVTSYE